MNFLIDNFGAISAIGLLIILVVSTIRTQGLPRSSKREGDFYPVVNAEPSGSVPPPNLLTYNAPGETKIEELIDDHNYVYEPPNSIYHGTPFYDALVEIYIFRLFRIGPTLDINFTDSIEGAKSYAGPTGYIIKFQVPAEIELIPILGNSGEYRTGVPDVKVGDYVIFDGRDLQSCQIFDGNGKAITDQDYAQKYLEINLS